MPTTATTKPEPSNFLEQHALLALRAEPTWTLAMYAALNDLSDQTVSKLREFLRHHLPTEQL